MRSGLALIISLALLAAGAMLVAWIASGAARTFSEVGEHIDDRICEGSDRSDDNDYFCYEPE